MRIMIFAVATLGLWSLATSMAQAQSSLPPIVREAIEASWKDCTESTVLKAESVSLEAGFVVERDVNGDGRSSGLRQIPVWRYCRKDLLRFSRMLNTGLCLAVGRHVHQGS